MQSAMEVQREAATGEPPRLLSIAETAARCGQSAQGIRDLFHRGDLPFPVIRFGRKLKVRSVDLDRWLTETTS